MDTVASQLAAPSRWQSLVHLYLPFVSSFLFVLLSPYPQQLFPGSPTFVTAILTNVVASIIYPPNQPPPTPEQTIPFTQRRLIYRAAVAFTFNSAFPSPHSLNFFTVFLLDIFVVSRYLVPDRNVNQPQRRSEFLAAAKWALVTEILARLFPQSSSGWLHYLVYTAEWILLRKAYMGLVDDMINVLSYPNMSTWRGRILVPLLQCVLVWLVLTTVVALVLGPPPVDENGNVLARDAPSLKANTTQ
ncbi:hypothetical protein DM02DRAFT_655027 [Periconia macrospinosa]|uniref:Uncharacterized protein n=1 Tax=Periconia macrospinosa TaxID=97972 RepID=A0A2V1DRW0_9PLEO|nr:hypothetical protein DM02DRAFT_655027 [Periconia macrospinosa]